MEINKVKIKIPAHANVIIGQAHFIKTVEDIYEALIGTVPGAIFGIGFCEASGKCLVRSEGNNSELKKAAQICAYEIGAGHCFVIFIRDCFPINILRILKDVPEICNIFCATANPVEVLYAETGQGRGILGVIDGARPKGIEKQSDVKERRKLLRKFKYKLS